MMRSDWWTIAGIAIAAMCIVTADHEAIGHGTACLSQGGHIDLLTSVYFRCSVQRGIVAAGGPIGNLVGGGIAWLLLFMVPSRPTPLALLFLLIGAFALFWEAGYLLEAMTTANGDSYFAARALFGGPEWPWRMIGFALGLALYVIGIRLLLFFVRRLSMPPEIFRLCWFAASLAAIAAAALYAPDRRAMLQAALEIGAASLPLLWIARRSAAADAAEIPRSLGWIAGSAIVYLVFAASLGHGLPYAHS
ncbi:MAG TPA: hypothetical protein VHW69_12015 [Rhizomicrobium sp.]|jgi:hypothetical protein|nr:hypothetical protein [Rhizomicrobium sp.]